MRTRLQEWMNNGQLDITIYSVSEWRVKQQGYGLTNHMDELWLITQQWHRIGDHFLDINYL